MKTESFYFNNAAGSRLSARLYFPEKETKRCVIFCHGLFSNKDGYKITRLADDIVEAGFALFTFDFSCVGQSDGEMENLSVLQEARDLESAVEWCRNRGFEELHLFGSSMGALVCLLYAQTCIEPIASISLIAPPLNLQGLYETAAGIGDLNALPDDGKTCIDGISLKNAFFKEALAIFPEDAAQSITVPVLIIHGAKDEVVDVTNAYRLMQLLKGTRTLTVIGDGDHNLTRAEDIQVIKRELLHHITNAAGR